jgi:hypothetical protein
MKKNEIKIEDVVVKPSYYETNRSPILERKQKHYETNRSPILEIRKNHYETNSPIILEKRSIRFSKQQSKIKELQNLNQFQWEQCSVPKCDQLVTAGKHIESSVALFWELSGLYRNHDFEQTFDDNGELLSCHPVCSKEFTTVISDTIIQKRMDSYKNEMAIYDDDDDDDVETDNNVINRKCIYHCGACGITEFDEPYDKNDNIVNLTDLQSLIIVDQFHFPIDVKSLMEKNSCYTGRNYHIHVSFFFVF